MKKPTLLTILLTTLLVAAMAGAQAGETRITVRADQVLHPVSRFLTGACIEDVNHEIYGGLYSQMVFGESFEEAAMPLPAGTPAFAGLSGAVSCRAPRREIAGSDVRSWQPFRTGSAEGAFAVETAAPFNGRQSQRMTFAGGTGAVGIENRGLNRQGMCFQAGKPYEGYVWVRRDPGADAAPVVLQVALENADGSKLHTRTELAVTQQDWQRLDFVLTPDAADTAGRFSITLTRPGTVVLGHAFLQPGAWGRFKGLPVRKDVVEGMLRQGLTALRYGGSMVNGSDEYRWKKMVGPRDRRPPYGGTWYEYSSNGWGILDFIDLCEAAQFACVPCFNTGESAQDMADFVEYVNGPADSEWGRKRAEAGHPEPYRLKYLQLGNEQHVDGAYYEAFTRLAGAIWKRDPGITLIVGVHWDPDKSIDQHAEHYRRVIEFARDRNQTVWFDVHVWNDKPHEPDLTAFDRFVGRLAGFGMDNYRICVLEENAGNHSMKRALGHARALNLFQRSKLGIPILCAANGLQPDDQNDNGWNQGMLFLNPSQVWLQPPGYVTQMVSRNYQPLCVSARVDGPESPLDVTATRSEDGGTLVLQVLNASGDPVPARIVIDGFTPAGPAAEAVQLVGRPDDTNTAEESARIVPETKPDALRLRDGNADYTFPGGSFTILRFRGSAGAAQPSASAGKVPAKSAEWAKQINKTKLPDEVRAQQVKDLKFGMFICWSFSTFYGEEWTPTTGKDASFFKATGCDTDQWCKTAKEAGMNYILFLTKHHDGFCLWDTDTTDKKVTNSPLGIDVLAKLKDSCDRHGIKLALYFSDGDWMWPKAKDGQYMAGGEDPEMKKAQLKELLTRYGPIEYFWLDTAVGVGGLDRKPTIDWIHEFQPNAFVGYPHKGMGPRMTMREMGRPGPFDAVEKERGYLVAEFTYPILPPHKGGANWFYSLPEHDNLCKKAGDLYKDYQEGVKHGNVFALNVGPDYAGRLRDIDVRTLREIGEMIRTNAP